MVLEKDTTIDQLKETIEVMELKLTQLEHLCEIKDQKIEDLEKRITNAGII